MSQEEKEMADFLYFTATDIDQEPETEVRSRYDQFVQACRTRTERQVLEQQADMDAYAEAWDNDLADYERAERAQARGELHTAAEWYRKPADNDFADSALKLADVLERIAALHLMTMPSNRPAASELYFVIEEASKRYIEALMAGDISFDEWEIRHERLLNYLDPSRVANDPTPTTAASAQKPWANGPRPRTKPRPLASGNDKPYLQKSRAKGN
jgi:hypothetical protein